MNKNHRIYAIALLAMFSFGGLAQAQALNSPETQALLGATVSLSKAVEISEKQSLGKSLGAMFDIEKGRALWEVVILNATGLQEFKVDASTGQVIKIKLLTNFVSSMNLKDLETAKTTLAQAVAMAERQSKGKAIKVQVEHERGSVQFDVSVRVGDSTKKSKIDAESGKAL